MSQVSFGKRGAPAARQPATVPTMRRGASEPSKRDFGALYARLSGDEGADTATSTAAAPGRIDARDVELCVGPGWSDFEPVNERLDDGAAVAPSFCLAALLTGPVWLAHRKQWGALAVFAAATLALELFLGANSGWWIALANLPLAVFARDLVVRRARAVVAKSRGSALGADAARSMILRQGGTSRLGGFVFAAIGLAAAVASTLGGVSGLVG